MQSIRKCHAEVDCTTNLGELRRHLGLSQTALGDRLPASQPHVAQLEGQQDMLLSTLRRYVEALGGELELVVRLPTGPTQIKLAEATNDCVANHRIQQPSGGSSCVTSSVRVIG